MQIKNFNIIRSLERNTLSELFLARHVHENFTVKIRLYDQLTITNEEVREAILQRLRNSYQMRHRNIIATLDYGVEGRYLYQVQEHMDHGNLQDLLTKVPSVPPEIAVFILQEMLRGLQYAHSIGIFHGMLNPAKVLLSSNGIVKIDDFQFLDLKSTFLKQISTRIKARQQMYLAPEHLLGKEADHRCDLFSAGVIAYKTLTGRHPFLEELSEWTAMQIIACIPKLLFELDCTLPQEIEELVEKMIEKDPGKRLQNAEDAIKVLDTYADRFGEVRSYEVLANFLRKPGQSVEQLNLLRAEEFAQQGAQFHLQEQWDRALIAYHRAQFLRPKEKNIEHQIKSIYAVKGYLGGESLDPKFVQLEQSLKTSPDNLQILQRLATLAKSRGDLIKSIIYYKRILKVQPDDPFARTQLKQMLSTEAPAATVGMTEVKWTRWQDFYRKTELPFWQRWSAMQGNVSLTLTVFVFALLIAAMNVFHLVPKGTLAEARTAFAAPISDSVVENQKVDTICEKARAVYQHGDIDEATEILAKTPLPDKGVSAAKARILLAHIYQQKSQVIQALGVLESVDVASADFDQKILVYKMKADLYKEQGRFGHAIDQYINLKALPGISVTERQGADAGIAAIQNAAMQQPAP